MSVSLLYANESREIRNHRNKTSGTSMERFGNARCIEIRIVELTVCLSLTESDSFLTFP